MTNIDDLFSRKNMLCFNYGFCYYDTVISWKCRVLDLYMECSIIILQIILKKNLWNIMKAIILYQKHAAWHVDSLCPWIQRLFNSCVYECVCVRGRVHLIPV